MNNPIVAFTKILPALAMVCALAAITAEPAAAQTAKKLKCTGCVKSKQVKDGALTGLDLKNGSVGAADLANNAVNSAKIANGAVGAADLANNAVNGAKIADGTVGNADLANDAVNSANVVNNSLTAGDLAADSVGNSELANNAVTGSNVIDGSLGAPDLASNSVGAAEIAASAVGSSEVLTNSIPATDLSNEAGADFQGANEIEAITATDETVRSVSITAPSGGRVIVVASGTWDENLNPTTGRCSITTGTTVDLTAVQQASLGADLADDNIPFALTRGFTVGTGTTTFRLVCDILAVTGDAFIIDAQMTAMYFPTQY